MREEKTKNLWNQLIELMSYPDWETNPVILNKIQSINHQLYHPDIQQKKKVIQESHVFYEVIETNDFYDYSDFNLKLLDEIMDRFNLTRDDLISLTSITNATISKIRNHELPKQKQISGVEELFKVEFYTKEKANFLENETVIDDAPISTKPTMICIPV